MPTNTFATVGTPSPPELPPDEARLAAARRNLAKAPAGFLLMLKTRSLSQRKWEDKSEQKGQRIRLDSAASDHYLLPLLGIYCLVLIASKTARACQYAY